MNLFIKKLIKKENIKITTPSEEICESYLQKSEKSLISSKTLLKIGNFDDATALTYYSMYNSALALMFKAGLKCENHTGTIVLLKELFEIDNKPIRIAKKERIDKQYYVEFKATKKEVEEGIKIAEKFNSIIKEKINTIKESKIKELINKFKKTYF